jgi:uncharacterized protein (TIGR03118 family)
MQNFKFKRIALGLMAAALGLGTAAPAADAQSYAVTNLISDGSVPATVTDSNFINPWAISTSGTWWISANATGYNYAVSATTGAISFKVIVPAPNGTSNGAPTGSVTTSGSSATAFILPNGTKASFLFSTDDGTISGWNSKLGTANAVSQIVINNSAANAAYNGLAIVNTATASYLLAPNFGTAAKVEVYDQSFKPTTLAGSFTDPSLPTGYAPYGIHIINNQIFVTFAPRGAAPGFAETVGAGNGVVDVFDLNGNFVARAVTGGNLNEPWGVAIAPATFGIYANDLLVGNFGDGMINVYDPVSYKFLGQITDGTGKALVYPSLWELLPAGTTITNSTSVSGGTAGTVYFTAGLANQAHGLLGALSFVNTGGTPAFGAATASSNLSVTAGSSVSTGIAISPTNNFSGTVLLTCTTPIQAVICSFSPASLAVSGTAVSTGTLTVQTTARSASLRTNAPANGISFALLFPIAGLTIIGLRRRIPIKMGLMALSIMLLGATTALTGCGQTSLPSGSPAGSSVLTVTAASGALTQTMKINLTIN